MINSSMRLFKLVFILFISFSFSSHIFSQNLKETSDYYFEKYAVEQGTAMNSSIRIFQDKIGYIWITSQAGLDRFDGYKFTNFANISSDSTSTNLRWVNSINQDSKGNIWATDQFGNISNYNRFNEEWNNYYPHYKDSIKNVPDGVSGWQANLDFYPQPMSIVISSDDRFAYVAVYGLGLMRIDSETGEEKYYTDSFDYAIWWKLENSYKMIQKIEWLDENRIILSSGNGIRIFDTRSETYTNDYFNVENIDDRIWVRDFQVIDSSTLWLATAKGLAKADLANDSLQFFLADENENSITSNDIDFVFLDKENNQLWISVYGFGIDIMDTKTNEFLHLNQSNSSLMGNIFNNIIKDNQENIWISTVTNGVLKYDPGRSKFEPFLEDSPKDLKLGFSVVWGALIDQEGTVWIGSREPGGGILNIDVKNNKTKLYAKRNNNSTVTYSIFEDNVGGIWAFAGNAIMIKKKNEAKFSVLGTYNNLKSDKSFVNRFNSAYLTIDGDLIYPSPVTAWIADKNGKGVFKEYKKLTDLIKDPIKSIKRKDSIISFVITDRSIWRWNERDNIAIDLTPNSNEKLLNFLGEAQSPAVFYDNTLYFGTYGNGILYINLDNEDIGFITTNEGLTNMYLYDMYKDADDNFWMSSNYGIIKYNPRDTIFRNYTPIDGTQGYEFNANSSYQSEDGTIVMGGGEGINYFNPSEIDENSKPPKVIIQNITIGNNDYNIDSQSNDDYNEIQFADNSVSFEYLAFNFRNTYQNQYRYKMEGYDDNWIEAGNRRFVGYTNLPIGSYTFRVQGSNNDDVWNEEGAYYKFTILPPWYRTWLAYAGYLLLLGFGFNAFGKYQARKSLEQADNERRAGELEEAKKIQQSMLPKAYPTSKLYDISAGLVTSTEIGGDYYDFFENKESIYAVCGDATGHGTASGMMVSIIKAGLNGLPALSTNKVLEALNNIVKKIDLGTLKMSLNICEIEKDSITLSSAAMPPIYHFSSKSKQTEEILIIGLPLGGLKNEQFDVQKRKFESNDVLVLLSDGLPEAENAEGELYDYERVQNLITDNATKSAEEIKDIMIGEVDTWLEGKIPDDDVTIVVIKKN